MVLQVFDIIIYQKFWAQKLYDAQILLVLSEFV
jgi:hypothetical protein